MFWAVMSVVIAYRIYNQTEIRQSANMEFPIGAGMGPDLMTRNGEQNFRQLQQ
jgi:hypothetical protein